MTGIKAFGGYVPRYRLSRAAIFAANGWFAAGLKGLARGERAMGSWDEDTITMAVEAARDCLGERAREAVGRLTLASTTLPFADRQNSTVVKEALNLPDGIAAFDIAGSQRAGTSALLDALQAGVGSDRDLLCVAAERPKSRPGSEGEMTNADAAAALLVGKDELAAVFLGGHSVTVDFVDRFRESGEAFDYSWEARWIREEGYGAIVPEAIAVALAKTRLTAAQIDRFILASPMAGVSASVAKKAGIRAEAVVDTLGGVLGHAGAAQPLVLLSHTLERAAPGETILLAGFGNGCDVIVLRTTGLIDAARPRRGITGHLADRKPIENYMQYLAFAGLLELEKGMRAELDQKPVLSALYRERKTVLGLVGGKCRETGTVQFPKSPLSVATGVRALNTQDDYPLAERPARIISYTADNLTFTPHPPSFYGGVEFDGGGRMMAEFVDLDEAGVEVGMPVHMVFRIKATDERRHFTKYFWKAAPERGTTLNAATAAAAVAAVD
ncbi:3-oxoacyl-[acyl-carrier-protein] synthase III C-terminal domain-containing protein [Caballeronia sp. AZ7_KS35]|uniref:hydroxymethylglutaryl-CoA synthase family protein n=1 Tax=Caballeronia sp. AZ7_KS35 TaxID=2921762 RepID=UPI002028BFF1|nr:3-oxoacyl-[acyl-carrier-protein] synthase III C-terminal domain-containing protein [Caballeronia sp. AZ7_KS35]